VELGVDAWIPYIAWTWPVYYAADLYILLGLPMILWRLPFRAFVAAILTAAAVILGGAMLQVLVPARSPWPEQLTSVQAWYHRAVNVCPWTCFPSMHVALVVLGTGFAFSTTRSVLGRSALATLAIAIAASTLTLKEHYVMDVLVGTVLALIGYRLWFRGCSSHLRPLWSISH
jgi:membrane-associated phospholipid phosphatase